MNSNSADRSRRRPRRGTSSSHSRKPHGHSAPHQASSASAHAAPALEPFPVETAPLPFATLGLDPRLLEGIKDLGFSETRPIQSAVITLSLAGADLIACAETGSGKTCAFVVPMLQRMLRETGGHESKSRVLVLAPTRELAVQIEDEIHGLSYHTTLTSAAVYGGVEMGGQERALKAGVDIIVATPGRLIDHMRQQNADLSAVELLVLDEADRMMDMGFWPDVRRIISALPGTRQTLLFSATMPDDVVRSALEIVKEPKFVQVGQRSAAAKTITHSKHEVPSGRKADWLIDHLKKPEGPVLIFSRTKIGADKLARKLQSAGIRCVALHADRTMDQRRQAVEGFRGGKYKVLVATDIAARGLDIDGIHTVINYEVPDSPDTYVHRVGRTGRSGEAGNAITLVSPDEHRALAQLEKIVGVHLQ